MRPTSVKQMDPSIPMQSIVEKQKKVSFMPFFSRGNSRTIFSGVALGFVAMLGLTGNLNRHFFRNVIEKWTRDQPHTSVEGSKMNEEFYEIHMFPSSDFAMEDEM